MVLHNVTRLLVLDDVPELTAIIQAEREFMAPWDPVREDDYFTEHVQLAVAERALGDHGQGRTLPLVILDHDQSIAGRLDLNGITRGAFQSASMGYWVRQNRNGAGLATAAVGDGITIAFAELGLHRVQAETLVNNSASQRVLAKNGFQRYGLAPQYLKIAGRWEDHILYQRLASEAGG